MKRTTAFLSATLIATGLASGPVMAASQSQGSAAQSQGQTQAQQNFSDQQLQNFASASQEIAGISQTYTKRLQNADGSDQQQNIRQEANDKMVQAVKDNGLKVDEFNQIGQAVQNNPQMMQKVQKMAQQQQ
ncbi:DUF4168 domain-containing protein [Kushneria phosphatilytica]|uniref:DUF4168 domain-containing protein n=1 Tax=Kushneria phosphatilytica TaxID=657387 RepID=A0A1S1P012_9GAMM|nr:DUF4168 domain-containing protein [Kushneria phosphatilytica]OHV12778.1 hypothetical protein BH688_01655 [Kushneria phosphatilytica]QEL10625.1 DUF4168 domain-containing protein [Kushneria phosphatilytica]